MFQAATTDLFNPLVPKADNSDQVSKSFFIIGKLKNSLDFVYCR